MLPALTLIRQIRFEMLEAIAERYSINKMFLNILQNSLENVYAGKDPVCESCKDLKNRLFRRKPLGDCFLR